MQFRFVEVKHRLHLRTVRQPELLQHVLKQTNELRERWHAYYLGASLKPIERAVRVSQLALIMRFYADRALRHGLDPQAYARLSREIDALVLNRDYKPADIEDAEIGYIFCPEHRTGFPERLYVAGGENSALWLYGPNMLPDSLPSFTAEPNSRSVIGASVDGGPGSAPSLVAESAAATQGVGLEEIIKEPQANDAADTISGHVTEQSVGSKDQRTDENLDVDVQLGTVVGGADPVSWRVSIRGNPHLMIVGLPGMGKTTCLVNICRQLQSANISPIVFSYHEDIDEKLGAALGELDFVDYNGLGFNPLRVDVARPTSHVDVAGTLRDIFASIFPDLGDLQLEELRQAIKQSFEDVGWVAATERGDGLSPPLFRAFFDILCAKTKPRRGLLARLRELADYGFSSDRRSGKSAFPAPPHNRANSFHAE